MSTLAPRDFFAIYTSVLVFHAADRPSYGTRTPSGDGLELIFNPSAHSHAVRTLGVRSIRQSPVREKPLIHHDTVGLA